MDISWAFMVLNTRAFSGNYLVPLLDLINHSTFKHNTVWYLDDVSRAICLKAITHIETDEEVLISYGDKSS